LRMPFPIVIKSVSNSRLDIFFDWSLIVATLKSLLLVILIVSMFSEVFYKAKYYYFIASVLCPCNLGSDGHLSF